MLQKDGQLPQAKKMLVAIVSKFSNEGDLMQALCNKMASETLKLVEKRERLMKQDCCCD